ncbi:MAG: tetratricopeptide repeat protein [Byssovorax sp.]
MARSRSLHAVGALLGAWLWACSPPPPPPPAPQEDPALAEARQKSAEAQKLLQGNDTDGALGLALEALDLRRRAAGEASADAESSLEQLGDIYFARGQLDVAEKVLRRALDIRTILVGADHPALAPVLDRLFTVLDREGKLDAAVEVAARSVALRSTDAGAPSFDLAASLLNQGSALLGQCKVAEAAPLVDRALAAAVAAAPKGSPLLARFLDAKGDVDRYEGRRTDALAAFEREERLLLVRDAAEARRMLGLLRRELAIHDDRGDLEQRSAVIARALVLVERLLPPRDPAVLELALPLATVFDAAGNRPKAVLLYQRLHLAEHTFPLAKGATSTRIDPPAFRLGDEVIGAGTPSRNACVPRGEAPLSGAAGALAALGPRLAACYGALPPRESRAPVDLRLVLQLGPKGEVHNASALTFDDVPDALVGCVLGAVAGQVFPPPYGGAERVVLPLHVAPDPVVVAR